MAVKRAAAKAVSTQAQLMVDINGVITPWSEKRLARFKAILASFERAQQKMTSLVSMILSGKGPTSTAPGSSPIYMIIDLVGSPERRSLSPFLAKEQGVGTQLDGDPFYFEVEAYTSSSGKPAALKRRKAGDFIHGGQFEHILQACSLQRDTSRMMGIGFLVNIDMLATLMVKNEERDRGMNGLSSFIDTFKPSPLMPNIPVNTTPANTGSNSNGSVVETAVKRQLGLVIVRDKDKEKEKKEKAPQQIEAKVAAHASALFGMPVVVVNLSSTSVSTGAINGICCAVEASYAMLREIGTYVLSVMEGPTQMQSEALVQTLSPTHSKRFLKTVLNALANIPVPVPATMTASASSFSVPAASSTCTVFLFSILDERFDICTYSPALLRAHLK